MESRIASFLLRHFCGTEAVTLPELLLEDWNVYMAQTWAAQQKTFPVRARALSGANLSLLEKLVVWCRGHHVEPRLWLYFLFKTRGWRFPPRFDEGCLLSEKLIPKFGKLRDGLGFFRRRTGASAVAKDEAWDPNRDVSSTVEALKGRYQQSGQAERCMDETVIRTFGFHPSSAVCCACPIRSRCAEALEATVPFPILALRAGRFSSAEAAQLMESRT